MANKRIVIADTELSYIIPLQVLFIEEFYCKKEIEDVEIEVITEKEYYSRMFSEPQRIEILVVSEELYSPDLQRHDISNIFLMMEHFDESYESITNVHCIQKYSSFKAIMSQIIGKSGGFSANKKSDCKIITVYSAAGGVGKTSVAVGLAGNLARNYKKVLYINASWLQTFQRLLDNRSAINDPNVYIKLSKGSDSIYDDIKGSLRNEIFTYLPPFKAGLMSLGLDYSIYQRIALSAKESKDFDFIIVDADSDFNDEKASLIEASDKVIIVTTQNASSVYATNILVTNINGVDNDKYMFICNDFKKGEDNALSLSSINSKFQINVYVEHMDRFDDLRIVDIASIAGIGKLCLLII